jgi:ADP-ribose pyrophosphatase YjhB (NUDIX family)
MDQEKRKKCVVWISELQSIAQNGLVYAKDLFDLQRYDRLRELCATIAAHISFLEEEKILELFSHDSSHATPKVDVRGALFKQEKILMVRENSDGLWTLPGGWADMNESPREAIEREVLEESGFKAKALKLIALYDELKHEHPVQIPHTYKLFFLCKIDHLNGQPDSEISEVEFFTQDNLPPLSIERITHRQIERCFIHYKDPGLPTEFD